MTDLITSNGWKIFPCKPDKSPYTQHGYKDATTDQATINRWLKSWPDCKIGIPCEANNFFSVDVDPDGMETWHGWINKYGRTGAGPCQRTPRGGLHVLFRLPDFNVPNNAGILAKGIDLRSAGYICTGEGYTWIDGHGPGAELTDAPAWLVIKIKSMTEKKQTIDLTDYEPIETDKAGEYWLSRAIDKAFPGCRNETGFWLSCQLRDSGLSQGQAVQYVKQYAAQVPGKDYSEGEAMVSLSEAYKGQPRTPAILPEVKKNGDFMNDIPKENFIQEKPRYILRNAAYALQPQPPINYVVDGLITNSSVNVIYGEPGSKKTYSALSLAACVANEKNWLDFKTKKASVLFIDEESGERRFSRRLGETIRGELCNEESPIYYVCLAGFNLDDESDIRDIEILIIQTGARLVIFDALADIMNGDENSKQDTQPVFNALRKMAENTDCAILIIHHSNKQGGYRGSSAIKGSVDLMIQVTSDNGSNLINFQTEKNRDGEKTNWSAEAVWTEEQFYLKTAGTRSFENSPRETFVMNYLYENGASYINDIMSAADVCSPQNARQAVYALAKQNKIKRTNPGERKAMYELSQPVTCNVL